LDFGLIFELETREPRSRRRDYDVLWNAVAQAVAAEQSGYSHVWAVEHHFVEQFSHCSAPEILLAAIAQRTETIRIGHGVVQLIPEFNHPVRVAERAAALDILSNGRLELGTGRASNPYEILGWGVEGNTREMWLESLRLICDIWKAEGEPVDFEGDWVTFRDRSVWPLPMQQPHPPLWMAATSPETYTLAGRLGLGVMAFALAIDSEKMGRRIAEYREAISTADPIGAVKNERVGVMMMTYCAETSEEAQRIARAEFNWYLDEVMEHFSGWKGAGKLPAGYEWYQKAANNVEKLQATNFDYLLENNMLLVGTPAEIIENIKRFEAIGVEQILTLTALGGVAHEDVMRSIELFGREVVPHFPPSPVEQPVAAA